MRCANFSTWTTTGSGTQSERATPGCGYRQVQAPGYRTLITRVFAEGDEYLDTDATFGVKETLIAEFVRHGPGTAPDGTEMDVPFYTMNYDFVLAPSGES